MARKREHKAGRASESPHSVEAEQSGTATPEIAETTASATVLPSDWHKQALLQGWISLAAWMTFGLLLEGLLGYKTPSYLLDNQRRELFRLAHTHGTLLSLLVIAAALCEQRLSHSPPRIAMNALRVGAALMPPAFLLAGIWHYESDPGVAIWLVPPAALLLIFGVIAFALASYAGLRWKE